MSSDTLPCKNHQRDTAIGVCGTCGDPLCPDCTEKFTDPAFRTFKPGGLVTLIAGFVLLVGVPVFLLSIYPDFVTDVSRLVFGGTVFLETGLVHSSVILGAALLLSVWFKHGDGIGLVSGQAHERILCDECYHERRQLTVISKLVLAIAAVIIIYGLYTVATDGSRNPNRPFFFREIRIIAAGIAIYVLRDEITLLLDQFR